MDAEIWAGMSTPLPTDDHAMARHLDDLVSQPGTLAFAVEWADRLIGRTTLYDLVPGLRVEIGNTVYARDAWGSSVNPMAKLLLFSHAFGLLNVGRVAMRCDHRNARSHHAIAKLGAHFEGTLRGFRRAADGSVADVDYFSVLADEWPTIKAGLEQRLARQPS